MCNAASPLVMAAKKICCFHRHNCSRYRGRCFDSVPSWFNDRAGHSCHSHRQARVFSNITGHHISSNPAQYLFSWSFATPALQISKFRIYSMNSGVLSLVQRILICSCGLRLFCNSIWRPSFPQCLFRVYTISRIVSLLCPSLSSRTEVQHQIS